MTLMRVTSEQYHTFNLRLEHLQKENLELGDEIDFLKRQNDEYKQTIEKISQDLDHFKALYSQSQAAISKNSLEIKQLKSLQSLPSSMDVTAHSPLNACITPQLVNSEIQEYPPQLAEDRSIILPIPGIKHRSVSMSPMIPSATNIRFASQIDVKEEDLETSIKLKIAESSRLLSEMYKQEVLAGARLKCNKSFTSKARVDIATEACS